MKAKSLKQQYEEATTPAQKRVIIAKDVLAQIDSGKYIPLANNGYFLPRGIDMLQRADTSVQDLIQSDEFRCEVCAIGSVFASRINLSNKCTVGQAVGAGRITGVVEFAGVHRWRSVRVVKGIFTDKMLREMEGIFENERTNFAVDEFRSYWANSWDNDQDDERSLSEVILGAIMNHFVRNNGAWRPHKEVEQMKVLNRSKIEAFERKVKEVESKNPNNHE